MRIIKAAGLILVAVGVYGLTNAEEETVHPQLIELEDIAQLKEQFNSDTGKRRLLLLLSPT